MPMKPAAPVVVSVVKNENKLATLKSFVEAQLSASGSSSFEITVVARSAASPVAQALRDCAADLVARQISVRAIFICKSAEFATWTSSTDEPAFACAVRWADDARLLDAHEQLVLCGQSAWIGDCMRRDPLKRDAFEQFARSCGLTVSHATRSFERLWAFAKPVAIGAAFHAPRAVVDAAAADIAPPVAPVDALAGSPDAAPVSRRN